MLMACDLVSLYVPVFAPRIIIIICIMKGRLLIDRHHKYIYRERVKFRFSPRWAPHWPHEPCLQGVLYMRWYDKTPSHTESDCNLHESTVLPSTWLQWKPHTTARTKPYLTQKQMVGNNVLQICSSCKPRINVVHNYQVIFSLCKTHVITISTLCAKLRNDRQPNGCRWKKLFVIWWNGNYA